MFLLICSCAVTDITRLCLRCVTIYSREMDMKGKMVLGRCLLGSDFLSGLVFIDQECISGLGVIVCFIRRALAKYL